MKQRLLNLVTTMLLLITGAMVSSVTAQSAVTVGNQVTSASNLVSGSAYLIRTNLSNTSYVEDNGSYYNCPSGSQNSPTEAMVFYLIQSGDGWKVMNAYTGKYWGTPTGNSTGSTDYQGFVPSEEASAGVWTLSFDGSGNVTPSCNGHYLNRYSSTIIPYGRATTFKIYEISMTVPAEINLTFDRAGAAVSDVTAHVTDGSGNAILGVTATLESASVTAFQTTGNAAITNTTNSVLVPAPNSGYGNQQGNTITYTFRILGLPSGFTYDASVVDVYGSTISGGSQSYSGTNSANTRLWNIEVATGATEAGLSAFTTGTNVDITSVDNITDGVIHNPWQFSGSLRSGNNTRWLKVTLTKGAGLGCFPGIRSVKLYFPPTASKVYTINNTNTSRGALIYNPDASTKWVWSSGKSGTFNASEANSQWIFYPTGSNDEYYLYNVGAGKFAVPTTGGTYSSGNGVCWKFSNDAAPVKMAKQADGTYQIYAPYGDRYMSVSNNYEGPIINYTANSDPGQFFTITKVGDASSDVSTALTTAVNRLIKNITPLAATSDFTTSGGWYVIYINSGDWGGHSFRCEDTELSYNGTNYPIGFYGYGQENASIASGEHLFRITKVDGGYTWQMPNGKYLYNPEQKFPLSTPDAVAISIGKTDAGFSLYHKSTGTNQYTRYATAYNLNSTHFIGETSTTTNLFNIYPANLDNAGLVAWQMIYDAAGESTKISCSRSDVSGLTEVYKNGYIFLPSGVTPTSEDFSVSGATGITVNTTAHTVTFTNDPDLAIITDGVSVYQGYGTTGLGNDKAVLLRIVAAPFLAMETATLNATLTGAEHISAVKLYETGNTVEWNTLSSYTQTINGTISDSDVSFDLGAVTAGTHYYWLCATVKNDAAVGELIDAALTGITYNRPEQSTVTCDLTSIGDPSNSMKIFDAQNVPFVPSTYSSNHYRIPAMITANDGSIIVAADKRYNSANDLGGHKIDVVVRRSTDGGQTWNAPVTIANGDGTNAATYGYGDPSFVKTASGKIICLMAAGQNGFQGGNLKNIAMVTSSDNGATWTSPVDITTNGTLTDNASLPSSFFVTSGKGLCTSDGVVMFLLDAYNSSNAETNYVLYSVDEGAHWIIDATVVCNGANEAKLQQLADGSLIASIRTNGARAFNRGTYVNNGNGTVTFTWGAANDDITFSEELRTTKGNNQDILYYSTTNVPNVLFHTMTKGAHADLNLYISTDNGSTWEQFMNIQPGGSRYAVMTKLANDDLAILFEDYSLETGNEYPINFVKITKEQIEDWYVEETTPHVKIVYGTTGEETYGAWDSDSKNTWTSNAASGQAGLTLTKSAGTFDRFSRWNERYNLLYKMADAGTATLTLTAPTGFLITGYSFEACGKTEYGTYEYTFTATDGTSLTPQTENFYTYNKFNVSGLAASSTTITVTKTGTDDKYVAIANFTVMLQSVPDILLNTIGNPINDEYRTLSAAKAAYDADPSAANLVTLNNACAAYDPTVAGTNFTAQVLPTGYYKIASADYERAHSIYNDDILDINPNKYTLQDTSDDGSIKTNNYLWHIVNNGDGTITVTNGQGTGVKTAGGNFSTLTFGTFNSRPSIFFTEALNANNPVSTSVHLESNSSNPTFMTTWAGGGAGAADNRWVFTDAAIDVAKLYNFVITSPDGSYVTRTSTGESVTNGGFMMSDVALTQDMFTVRHGYKISSFSLSDKTVSIAVDCDWDVLKEDAENCVTLNTNAKYFHKPSSVTDALTDYIAEIETAGESAKTNEACLTLKSKIADFWATPVDPESVPTSGLFVLKNYSYENRYIVADATNNKLVAQEDVDRLMSPDKFWQLTISESNTDPTDISTYSWTITGMQNAQLAANTEYTGGTYAGEVYQSAPVTLSSSAVEYNLTGIEERRLGTATIQFGNDARRKMHEDDSHNIVGWTADEAPTSWYFIDIADASADLVAYAEEMLSGEGLPYALVQNQDNVRSLIALLETTEGQTYENYALLWDLLNNPNNYVATLPTGRYYIYNQYTHVDTTDDGSTVGQCWMMNLMDPVCTVGKNINYWGVWDVVRNVDDEGRVTYTIQNEGNAHILAPTTDDADDGYLYYYPTGKRYHCGYETVRRVYDPKKKKTEAELDAIKADLIKDFNFVPNLRYNRQGILISPVGTGTTKYAILDCVQIGDYNHDKYGADGKSLNIDYVVKSAAMATILPSEYNKACWGFVPVTEEVEANMIATEFLERMNGYVGGAATLDKVDNIDPLMNIKRRINSFIANVRSGKLGEYDRVGEAEQIYGNIYGLKEDKDHPEYYQNFDISHDFVLENICALRPSYMSRLTAGTGDLDGKWQTMDNTLINGNPESIFRFEETDDPGIYLMRNNSGSGKYLAKADSVITQTDNTNDALRVSPLRVIPGLYILTDQDKIDADYKYITIDGIPRLTHYYLTEISSYWRIVTHNTFDVKLNLKNGIEITDENLGRTYDMYTSYSTSIDKRLFVEDNIVPYYVSGVTTRVDLVNKKLTVMLEPVPSQTADDSNEVSAKDKDFYFLESGTGYVLLATAGDGTGVTIEVTDEDRTNGSITISDAISNFDVNTNYSAEINKDMNILKATPLHGITNPGDNWYKYFVLSSKGKNIIFTTLSATGRVAEGKAYIPLDEIESYASQVWPWVASDNSSNVKSAMDVDIVFTATDDNDATYIAEPTAVAQPHNDVIYDLTGRAVSEGRLPKGIYIRNGKKVIMK